MYANDVKFEILEVGCPVKFVQTSKLILEEIPNLLIPVEHISNVPNHLAHVRVICNSQNRVYLFHMDVRGTIESWAFYFEKKCWNKLDSFNDRRCRDFAVAKLDDSKVLLMFKNENQSNIEAYVYNMDDNTRAEKLETFGYPGELKLFSSCTRFGNQVFVTQFDSGLEFYVKIYVLNLDNLEWQDLSSEDGELFYHFMQFNTKVINNKIVRLWLA